MTAYVFLAVHLAGLVGYTLTTRKLMTGGTDKYQLALIQRLGIFSITLLAVLFGIFEVGLPGLRESVLLLSSGVTASVFMALGNKTLQEVEASEFQILVSVRLVLISLVSLLLLDESVPALQLAGGGLIFLAIILLHYKKGAIKFSKSSWWGIALAFWFTLHAGLEKYNIDSFGVDMYLFYSGLASSILLFFGYKLLGKDGASWTSLISWKILIATLFRVMSAYGFILALTKLPLSLSSYVSSTSVIILVVAGYVFLGERSNLRQKLVASLVAFIGLTLIFLA